MAVTKRKAVAPILRPFETDYAGAWRGHCKTRESAIRAAIRHILEDGYTSCTISEGSWAAATVTRKGTHSVEVRVYREPLLPVKLRRVK